METRQPRSISRRIARTTYGNHVVQLSAAAAAAKRCRDRCLDFWVRQPPFARQRPAPLPGEGPMMKLRRPGSLSSVRPYFPQPPQPSQLPPQLPPPPQLATTPEQAADKKRNKLGYHRTSVACGMLPSRCRLPVVIQVVRRLTCFQATVGGGRLDVFRLLLMSRDAV